MADEGVRALPDGGGARVRVRLDLAYDGTAFRGWAAQPGLRTVEGELTSAISTVVRAPVSLTVAGRTDAGVHARHQVAHVDLSAQAWAALAGARGRATPGGDGGSPAGDVLVARVNGLLARGASLAGVAGQRGSADLVVTAARAVSGDFDARFSALGRHYRYRISDSVLGRDPLRRADEWWLDRGRLDVPAMREAAAPLLGEHDFLSYCKPRDGATTIRTLRELDVERIGGTPGGEGGIGTGTGPDTGTRPDAGIVEIRVSADAFCHSMVRSLVGALVEVGLGRRPATWPRELLGAGSRESAAPLAPACGLTLDGVDYPPEGEWAERARLSRRRRDEPGSGTGCCGGVEG